MLEAKYFLMEGEGDGASGTGSGGDGTGSGNAGDGTGSGNAGDGSGNAGDGSGAGDGTGGDGTGAGKHADTWFGKADEDTAAFITNKGWNEDPLRAVESYRHLEKLSGKDPEKLIELPREDDPEGQKAFWQKLGAPETADKYELTAAEGQELDPDYVTWARETFLELGIPADKAKALFEKNNARFNATQDAIAEEYETKVTADKEALKTEWRDGHDKMMHRANNAAKILGIPADAIDAIEATMGYGATMKLFANLGTKMSEDNFVSGDGGPGFKGESTPAEALAELDTLKLDLNFSKAITDRTHPGHTAAVEKRRALMTKAYPSTVSTDGVIRG